MLIHRRGQKRRIVKGKIQVIVADRNDIPSQGSYTCLIGQFKEPVGGFPSLLANHREQEAPGNNENKYSPFHTREYCFNNG